MLIPHLQGHGYSPLFPGRAVREGLTKISEKFAFPAHVGPKHVADFEAITDSEEREAIQRDAYERVNNLLEKLGIRSLIF